MLTGNFTCPSAVPCLSIPYDRWHHLLRWRLLHALPYLDAHISLYRHLSRFLKDPDLVSAFTFQAKYLGMSPWNCPYTGQLVSLISQWKKSGDIHTEARPYDPSSFSMLVAKM